MRWIALPLLLACAKAPSTPATPPPKLESSVGMTFFDYAYPLVLMKISRDLMQNSPLRPPTSDNHMLNFRNLARPENTAVVLGNRDTLYTTAWIDLSQGPVLFELPDMGDRYHVMPLLDAWSNTFVSIGSRTTGTGPHQLVLYRDGEDIPLVAGYEPIPCPTDMVWLTGRIEVEGPDDLAAARDAQAAVRMLTLAEREDGTDPFAGVEPVYRAQEIGKPVPFSLHMEPSAFYDAFFAQWKENPPLPDDKPFLDQLAKLGIRYGVTQRFDALTSATQKTLTEGLKTRQSQLLAGFQKGTEQTEPWIFNREAMGTWGTDYKRRAYWAAWGLGANLIEDAVYGVTQLDADLKPLSGNATYTLHFEPEQVPDVGGFWSITAYGVDGYLKDNPEHRYSVGSNRGLAPSDDGTVDVVLSATKPEGVDESRWLPVPEGEFKLLLRMYWPKEKVFEPSFSIPPVGLAPADPALQDSAATE